MIATSPPGGEAAAPRPAVTTLALRAELRPTCVSTFLDVLVCAAQAGFGASLRPLSATSRALFWETQLWDALVQPKVAHIGEQGRSALMHYGASSRRPDAPPPPPPRARAAALASPPRQPHPPPRPTPQPTLATSRACPGCWRAARACLGAAATA